MGNISLGPNSAEKRLQEVAEVDENLFGGSWSYDLTVIDMYPTLSF